MPRILLMVLIVMLLAAGGASRADVAGQIVVRCAAWAILIFVVIRNRRGLGRHIFAPLLILAGAGALTIIQLVPLPPDLWMNLPGREALRMAASSAGEPQPWRPISMAPSATINALSSLVVPFACVILMGLVSREDERRLTGVLLGVITIGAIVGLAQFAGANLRTPLVNFVAGDVSGPFANRNHFALFVAIGLVVALAWIFQDRPLEKWRLAALGLLPLFALVILATGSRAGTVIGALAILLGAAIVRRDLVRIAKKLGAPKAAAALFGIMAAIAGAVVVSFVLGRAASLDRLWNVEMASDLRMNAIPVVVDIARAVFPVGSGFGAFDPVYRIWEPRDFLSFAYLNHAHNDFLEIVVDGGLAGVLLLLAAVGWWIIRSLNVWRAGDRGAMTGQVGSAIILLVFVASATDYPARTPMIMALVAIAACLLGRPTRSSPQQ